MSRSEKQDLEAGSAKASQCIDCENRTTDLKTAVFIKYKCKFYGTPPTPYLIGKIVCPRKVKVDA